MNLKLAKKLRKSVPNYTHTLYEDTRDVIWGPLPRDPKTKEVNKKNLQKFILKNKDKNPKFRGQGYKTEYRYSAGIPRKMATCPRLMLKNLKKDYVEVAKAAN